MISVDVCRGRQVTRNVTPGRISDLIRSDKQMVWVDVEAPTDEDWEVLTAEFGFHPLTLEDARKQSQRAKVEAYRGYLFVVLRTWSGFKGPTDDLPKVTDEIDVFLGPNYLVTIHQDSAPLVAETRQRWEQHPELLSDQPDFLLYVLMDTIVDGYFPVMDEIDDDIDKIETAVYTAVLDLDVAPALLQKKRLLLLRQTVGPMRDVLNHLLRQDVTLVSPDVRLYLQDVFDHSLRLVEQVDLHRDILSGVLDAQMAQVNNRLNQVMKTLTGISTILMSAALISGIYGMNFKNMPELHWKNGYFMALSLMVVVAGSLALYFRRIKWF